MKSNESYESDWVDNTIILLKLVILGSIAVFVIFVASTMLSYRV